MKLTKQIAAAYIGAQVKAKSKYDECMGYGYILSPDRIAISTEPKRTIFNTHWFSYDECQLILTPLSAISDEDALEVARIEDIPQAMRFELFGKDHENMLVIGNYIKQELIESHKREGFVVRWQVADYLRSPYRLGGVTPKPVYDLGHLEIKSLIEAEIAIDSTKLNK